MAPKAIASASSATPAQSQDTTRLAMLRPGDDAAMNDEQIGTTPESQEARGLTPDEQRAERDRESRQTDESKFELLAEETAEEAEEAAERIAQPLEPRDED